MQASLPAALLVLLLSATWLLGRRRSRPFLRSTDTADVVALNRAQIERLRQPPLSGGIGAPAASEPLSVEQEPSQGVPQPRPDFNRTPPRPRPDRLLQLQGWLVGSREQRLAAVAVALSSGHRAMLPLLRRALRDPDPAVVASAAEAMARFRGRTAALAPAQPPAPWRGRPQTARPDAVTLPLKVSRTR